MEDNITFETEEVKDLSIKKSIPLIISMMSLALYAIVDTIFVSNYSDNALTASVYSFPIVAIITAVGLGCGIGLSTTCAKALGEKNNYKAKNLIFNSYFIVIISYLLLFILGFFIKPFFTFFTSDIEIIEYGNIYLKILMQLSLFSILATLFQKALECHGASIWSMTSVIAGSVVNLILDPVLIFALDMGIKGAAIASVIGQFVSFILALIVLNKKQILTENNVKEKNKFDITLIKEMVNVGFPTIVFESLDAFITLYINKLLSEYTGAVNVWGVYAQLQKFIIIITYGLEYGNMPIISYNYGAKRKDRIYECIKTFAIISMAVTLVGTILFELIPGRLINFYSVSEETYNLGLVALRILAIGFIPTSISIVISSVLQAFGKSKISMLINMLRKIIVVIPLILILGSIYKDVKIIWISFAVAEIVTMIFAIVFYLILKKKVIEKI